MAITIVEVVQLAIELVARAEKAEAENKTLKDQLQKLEKDNEPKKTD